MMQSLRNVLKRSLLLVFVIVSTISCCRICANREEKQLYSSVKESLEDVDSCLFTRLIRLPELEEKNQVYLAVEIRNTCKRTVAVEKSCALLVYPLGNSVENGPFEIRDSNNKIVEFNGIFAYFSAPLLRENDFQFISPGQRVFGITQINGPYELKKGYYTIKYKNMRCIPEPNEIEIELK